MEGHASRFAPYPELVEERPGERPFRIVDGLGKERGREGTEADPMQAYAAHVDLVRRVVEVPLAPTGRTACLHEMAHVRWSPREVPRVRYPRFVFLVVEDARVNTGLRSRGLPLELPREERSLVVGLARADLVRGAVGAYVLRTVASFGTNVYEPLLAVGAKLPAGVRDTAETLIRRATATLERARLRTGGEVAPVKVAIRVGRELARALRRRGWLESAEVRVCGCHAERLPGDGGSEADGGRELRPGELSIAEPPLSREPQRRSGFARKVRCVCEGSVVAAPHRWAIDRAIFRRSRRIRAGTVLVDVSGSMSFSNSDLEEILAATAGAALVAIYSGKGDRGELRIVARDGRRVKPDRLRPFGRGNIVDLPALEWLAGQAAPRVWISDGSVTGVGDRSCEGITAACARVCERAGIQQVREVEEAVQVLRRAKRRGRSKGNVPRHRERRRTLASARRGA